MEIHKPHAARSWREFLVEIGTITCGILIALGLEQGIEALHERHIAEEARKAIRAEVSENLWWLDRRTTRWGMCRRAAVAQLGATLQAAREGRPYQVIRFLPPLSRMKLTETRWLANAQAGRASLFPPEEQRVLGNIYFTTAQMLNIQAAEEEAWAKLGALQGIDHLTPQEVHDFSVALAEERYQNYLAVLINLRAHQWAARLHLTADIPDVERKALPQGAETCDSLFGPRPTTAPGAKIDGIFEPEDIP